MVFQQTEVLYMEKMRCFIVSDFINIIPNSERWLNLKDLPNEKWKDIKGYEYLYQISNYGRVKSLGRSTTKTHILKCYYTKNGYCRVCLCKNNHKRNYFVHLLVMLNFCEETYKNGLQVNHKNENKSCNLLSNLEWCDNIYNINYGTGIIRSKEKKYKPVAKYTLDDVFICKYQSIQDASLSVSTKHNKSGVGKISKCARGYIDNYRGFKWKFISKDNYGDASNG